MRVNLLPTTTRRSSLRTFGTFSRQCVGRQQHFATTTNNITTNNTPTTIRTPFSFLNSPFSSTRAFSQSLITMSSTPSFSEYGIESTDIKTGAGVELSELQKIQVGSVLDLFAGKPTVKKLSLWSDDATFADPLTIAEGRKQYSAQWYGLAAAFSEIERLSLSVVSAGNPIEMDLKTRYKVKGMGTEKTIQSLVRIHTEGNKIVKVEDKWDGEIPDGAFAKIFRNLNSVVVPAFVSVPKSEEEEAAKK